MNNPNGSSNTAPPSMPNPELTSGSSPSTWVRVAKPEHDKANQAPSAHAKPVDSRTRGAPLLGKPPSDPSPSTASTTGTSRPTVGMRREGRQTPIVMNTGTLPILTGAD